MFYFNRVIPPVKFICIKVLWQDSSYADMGMDVDKPHQLDMARRILGAAA